LSRITEYFVIVFLNAGSMLKYMQGVTQGQEEEPSNSSCSQFQICVFSNCVKGAPPSICA